MYEIKGVIVMNLKKWISIFSAIILTVCLMAGWSSSSKKQVAKKEGPYELKLTNGTRFFKSKVAPKSDYEKVVLDTFKVQINDNYDKLKDLYIDDEKFNYWGKVYKEHLEEGLYAEEINVHKLKTLSESEYYDNNSALNNYDYMDRLKKYNPYKFEIVEINYTIKLTDKFNKIAQFPNGNYTECFIMVKKNKNSEWRIFDLYKDTECQVKLLILVYVLAI